MLDSGCNFGGFVLEANSRNFVQRYSPENWSARECFSGCLVIYWTRLRMATID